MDAVQRQADYLERLYLRKATDAALVERLETIASNLWSTAKDGEVMPSRDQNHRDNLLGLYADTLFEQYRRVQFDIEFSELELRRRSSAH